MTAPRIERLAENVTLYLGDCHALLPEVGKVDALVFDPPYAFETSGGGKFRAARKCLDDIVEAGLDIGFDYSIFSKKLVSSVVVFCHNDQLPELLPFLAKRFKRFALCAWRKSNPMPVANRHYLPDTEFYIHAWDGDAFPIGASLADKRRSIETPVGKSEFDHPTVKPLAVMAKIVANVNAQTICDPFMGTGSTGVACVQAGRGFVGIERNPKYFDIAVTRIAQALACPVAAKASFVTPKEETLF
jgi:hypothetical protein